MYVQTCKNLKILRKFQSSFFHRVGEGEKRMSKKTKREKKYKGSYNQSVIRYLSYIK